MDKILNFTEKQSMVSSFLEIAVGESTDTARQFLQATSWKLEEAIQLYFIGNDGGALAASHTPPVENIPPLPEQIIVGGDNNTGSLVPYDGSEEVRAPLPVRREVLYDDAVLYRSSRVGHPSQEGSSLVAFRNFGEEMKRPGVWESDQNAVSAAESPRDNLASLYRPPFHLMTQGPFDKVKQVAMIQDKWLLVNLQSTKEFSSHMLNRDTWSNEAVAQTISTNFIFWQVYDDTTEGRKVCTYYNLESIPVVLVLDPITGQKMRSWSGMIEPERLLEELLQFMDGGPKNHHVSLPHKRPRETTKTSSTPKLQDDTTEEDEEVMLALAASMESMKDPVGPTSTSEDPEIEESETFTLKKCTLKKPIYPALPEEPKVERNLLCRVAVRLPDGRRVQRNFLCTDPIQLLWSFCSSQLDEADARPFHLTQAIPGASKSLDYESKLTFSESGLSNSMVSVTWD